MCPLHASLCDFQCAFWQVELQYLVILQQPQLNLALVDEQNAQDGAAEDMLLRFVSVLLLLRLFAQFFYFFFLLHFSKFEFQTAEPTALLSQVVVKQVVILLVDLRDSQRVSARVSGGPARKRFNYLQQKVECGLNKFDD